MGLMLFPLLALLMEPGPVQAQAGTPEENREIVRKAVELLEEADKHWARLFFLRRREVQEFDASGQSRSKESTTVRREPFEEVVITRLIARNDQPLTEAERAKQEEAIRADVARVRRERQKNPQKQVNGASRLSEYAEAMREFAAAMEFRSAGEESVEGRKAWVFDFSPRPGYRASGMKVKVMEKLRGKVWIDKASNEVVRADVEVFEQVNMAFGLVGRVGKGTTFEMQRREVAPGMWMPVKQRAKLEARLLLVKSYRQEVDVKWAEYRVRPETADKMAERRN
jgi:hypothetical protein